MLEGLDKIDWSKLTHANGEASDVPGVLRQLASLEADEREHALYELSGNIWHQGTVYDASAQAVPFLIELLESEVIEGKDEICILLGHLAKGTSYHDVHQHLPILKQKAQTPEWQADIQKELVWVKDVKVAVMAGKSTYLRFLADEDPALRDATSYLLASFDHPAPGLAAKIWSRFQQEPDERVQASLMLAFGILAEPVETNLNLIFANLADAKSKSVKLAAAMALVRLARDQLPREALAMLVEAAQSPNDYEALAKSVWARVDDMELIIINHLACLDTNSAVAVVDMLAKILPTCEHQRALTIAEVLLNMLFRNTIGQGPTFASLNGQQQRVLRLIAQNRNVWIEKVGNAERNSIRTSMLLRSCGLPDDLAKLVSFIGGAEHQDHAVPSQEDHPGFAAIINKFFKRTPPS